MTRVLLIGQAPETVDYSDPALPPGLDAAKIATGIALALQKFRERGWDADHCSITPDGSAEAAIEQQLARAKYDCVVIGGGIRVPPKSLLLFERVVNTVCRCAPQAAIAFNTRPDDSAEAAGRWLR